jgi:antagonist of KipI
MSLVIESPGILTTVQDLGRPGYRRFGINPGGPMDPWAVRLINLLLGNEESEAVLEMHFPAARIRFTEDAVFALGGADLQPNLEGSAVDNWGAFRAEAGQRLNFSSKTLGSRTYLAVQGGIAVTPWLSSSSTNLAAKIGGHSGRRLEAGDELELRRSRVPGAEPMRASVSHSLIPRYGRFPTVRIIEGAEYGSLDNTERGRFLGQSYQITNNSDRMGFRLAADAVSASPGLGILSSAVDFGTIQLLPDGQLIVLMADHQTTGGYPRLGHVVSVDLPLLGQLGPGDKVAFHLIDLSHAEELLMQRERELSFFKAGCRLLARP